jgi:hypothetical protein
MTLLRTKLASVANRTKQWLAMYEVTYLIGEASANHTFTVQLNAGF